MNSKLKILSICQKAGVLVSGEFSTMDAIKSGKAYLVLIAGDASANTKKQFRDKTGYRSIPLLEVGTCEELGQIIGKERRSSLAIIDKGFAESVKRKMEEYE